MDRIEMMLRYCTILEICHLDHVRPYSDEYETYGSDEPEHIEPPFLSGGSTRYSRTEQKDVRPSCSMNWHEGNLKWPKQTHLGLPVHLNHYSTHQYSNST